MIANAFGSRTRLALGLGAAAVATSLWTFARSGSAPPLALAVSHPTASQERDRAFAQVRLSGPVNTSNDKGERALRRIGELIRSDPQVVSCFRDGCSGIFAFQNLRQEGHQHLFESIRQVWTGPLFLGGIETPEGGAIQRGVILFNE